MTEQKKSQTPEQTLFLEASFKGVDAEGDKTTFRFQSEGKNVQEVLNNLEFPRGVNTLVRVRVKSNKKEEEVALAPHRARQILEGKDTKLFEAKFGKF